MEEWQRMLLMMGVVVRIDGEEMKKGGEGGRNEIYLCTCSCSHFPPATPLHS